MLEWLSNLLSQGSWELIIVILVAFNACLSAVGSVLAKLNLANAESILGKIAGWVKTIIDFIQGNLQHK